MCAFGSPAAQRSVRNRTRRCASGRDAARGLAGFGVAGPLLRLNVRSSFLPVADAMTVIVPISRQTRRPTRGRVLLVEDSFDELELYALILADDVDVLKASRGETGYAVACAERPDVIVLDILMPDMDGWQVRERLRRNPATASIPVLVMTGDDDSYEKAIARSDVFAALKKPCAPDQLLLAIQRALAPRRR
jgi:putative two-component system response regulator